MVTSEHDQNLRLSKYLSSSLSPEELRRFSRLLKARDLEDTEAGLLLLLRAGQGLSEGAQARLETHLTPEQITHYVEKGRLAPPATAALLGDHINSCDECRRLVEMATHSWGLAMSLGEAPVPRQAASAAPMTLITSALDLVKRYLLQPIPIRPAYGLLLILALSIPLYRAMQRTSEGEATMSVELIESEVRGARTVTEISLKTGTQLLHVAFALPVRADRQYEFELVDSVGRSILTHHRVPAAPVFTLDIPRSLLYRGTFALDVTEYDELGQQTETFVLPFSVVAVD